MKDFKKKALNLTASVLMTISPTIAKAHGFWNTRNTRTHWSPYAHSLVSGDIKYSPYAITQNQKLTSRDSRWSPYSHNLIQDNDDWCSFSFSAIPVTHINLITSCSQNTNNSSKDLSELINKETNYETNIRMQNLQRAKIREIQKNDPAFAIKDYLDTQKIKFKISHGLDISSKTIGTHFLLEESKTIIKYTNPEEAKNLKGYKQRAYKNFQKNSNEFCEKQKQLGWKISSIESDNIYETNQLIDQLMCLINNNSIQ